MKCSRASSGTQGGEKRRPPDQMVWLPVPALPAASVFTTWQEDRCCRSSLDLHWHTRVTGKQTSRSKSTCRQENSVATNEERIEGFHRAEIVSGVNEFTSTGICMCSVYICRIDTEKEAYAVHDFLLAMVLPLSLFLKFITQCSRDFIFFYPLLSYCESVFIYIVNLIPFALFSYNYCKSKGCAYKY